MPGSVSKSPSGEHFSTLFWKKKHVTIAYWCVFWSFGMCVAFLGPTLMDLGCKTGSTIATMGWVFFAQTLFILVGSATATFITKRIEANLVLFGSTVMLAVTLSVIPLCYAVTLLALVMAVMGYFMGVIDTLANVCMINLYGKDVSPFLQALHFFYGLGAFVSPMIAEPFLVGKNCNPPTELRDHNLNQVPENTSERLNTTQETLAEMQKKESRITYAFWIMALLQVPVICIIFTLLIRQMFTKGDTTDSASRQREEYEVMDKDGVKPDANGLTTTPEVDVDERHLATKTQALLLTMLTAFLLFLYDGLQAAYGGYVFSYAEKSVDGFTSSNSAYLNACFWGTFAFGRLVSIALATKLNPEFMLFCNICGCVFAMIFMLCFPHNHSILYMGTSILGIFMSSVYPTAISLAEQYISITSSLASCIIVGAATGEMILPVIVGHEFENVGPLSLLVTGVIMTLISMFVYAAIWVLGNSIIRRTTKPGVMGILQTFLPKRGSDTEDSGLVTHHVKYYSRMRNTVSESSFGADATDVGQELNNDDVR